MRKSYSNNIRSSVTLHALGLIALTSASIHIATVQTPYASQIDANANLPVARYAVIDLGTGFQPIGINNSNVMVSTVSVLDLSVTNVPVPLRTDSTYGAAIANFVAVGIDDAGNIAGNAWGIDSSVWTDFPTSRVGVYWTNSAAPPTFLGQFVLDNSTTWGGFGAPYQTGVAGVAPDGYLVGNSGTPNWALEFNPVYVVGSHNTAHVIPIATYDQNYGGMYSGNPGPDIGASGTGGSGLWFGYNSDNNAPVINGTSYSAFTNLIFYGMNTNNTVVGVDWVNNRAVMANQGSGTTLYTNDLGSGGAGAINNHTITDTNNVTTSAPQIIGWTPSPAYIPMLWDQTDYSGNSTNVFVPKILNKIIAGYGSPAPPWNVTSAHAINDYGAIAATVTKTSDNTSHSALLLPVKVTWETVADNTPIDDNNDPVSGKPMPGGGKRIYPDKQNPTDTGTGRNKVTLRVDAGKDAAGWKVYVQAFDIDDPTPDSVDVDKYEHHHVVDSNDTDTVQKGNDNLSDPAGTPQTGFFTDTTTASDNAILDVNGKKDFEFNVGYQPGNNYRVAVTFFKVDDLSNLQVTDSTQPGYVPPEASKTPSSFSGAVSPPLTVWRRLWIEQDSMAVVPTSGDQKNFIAGNVTSIARDTPITGRSTITTDTLFWDDANRFENGTMTINGTAYAVISNTDNEPNRYYPDKVVITGTPTDTAVVGKSFTIVDDDEYGAPPNWVPLMPRFNLVTNDVIEKYSPAYILIVDASTYDSAHDYNPHKTVPFVLNEDLSTYYSFYSNFSDVRQSMDLSTSANCWEHLVTVAYQGSRADDDDPFGSPTCGESPTPKFLQTFSVIYLETIRDVNGTGLGSIHNSTAVKAFLNLVVDTFSHEIAHAPGTGDNNADHAEGGLMSDDLEYFPDRFLAPTILRFRATKTWNGD